MARGLLVEEFDLWQPDYAGATVTAYQVGTTTPALLFGDEAMTMPAVNPQTLLSFTDAAGVQYGKFNGHIYSQGPYYLDINTVQQTGIRRPPLTDLVGIDASQAVATSAVGTKSRTLAAHLADVLNVADFGDFKPTTDGTASPATNNATLTAAIGAAAAAGGGFVICPAGSYEITGIAIPGNVVVSGRGKGVTTLVCKTGANCFTLTGDKAGFRDITLDGVNLVANSVGVTGFNRAFVALAGVEVKRFETGILFRGASFHRYRDLWVENCSYNARFLGDLNASGGSNGGPISFLEWDGGESIAASNVAIEFSQVDQTVQHCTLRNISISGNPGVATAALYLYGVQFFEIAGCIWSGNSAAHNVWLRDSANTALPAFQSASVVFRGGEISGSNLLFDGLARNVLLDGMDLQSLELQMNIPTGDVILRDCIEVGTTITGDTTKLERQVTRQRGAETGISTSATALVAWQRALTPGQVMAVEAVVTAVYLNGLGFASWKVAQAAHQLGAALNYNNQSANYTVGNTIKGQTSGATATITADADAGTTGTLTLVNVNGSFVDGELISELTPGTGAAHVNGSITLNATAMMGSMASLYSFLDAVATADAINVAFDTNGQNLRLKVTGAAARTILWTVQVGEAPSF